MNVAMVKATGGIFIKSKGEELWFLILKKRILGKTLGTTITIRSL